MSPDAPLPLPARTTLVLGGQRSGKSRFAEALVEAAGYEAVYIATARASDDREMAARIAAHQARRGARWRTLEEPTDLLGALSAVPLGAPALVDCLTLWLTNLLLDGHPDPQGEIEALAGALPGAVGPLVLVSNEVGLGIVPENALARRFADLSGLMNQAVAAACDRVVLVTAGLPLALKG